MAMKIAIGIAVVVVGFLIYVAMQPADYKISRSISIDASVERIFPYLNNSKLGDQWGPWKEVDPQAQMLMTGPEEGVGAKTSWDSKGQLGTGSAEIVESVPNQRVGIKISYQKPMVMEQLAEYSVVPQGSGSVVTWSVVGKNTFPARVACVFMNMDKVVGGMFEKGLANLKKLVEESKQ
jgi:hypothetical protein